MKQILLIISILLSTCAISQEIKAYVTEKGKFVYKDSTYTRTNYSGTMFTFEKMLGKLGDKEFIRIGVSKSYGKTYHDFEIKTSRFEEDGEYMLYFIESPFDSRVVLKYNKEDFFLFFIFDDNYAGGVGLWVNYYKGIILKPKEDE